MSSQYAEILESLRVDLGDTWLNTIARYGSLEQFHYMQTRQPTIPIARPVITVVGVNYNQLVIAEPMVVADVIQAELYEDPDGTQVFTDYLSDCDEQDLDGFETELGL